MTEHHGIAGPARGETLPADREGACVRIPLDGAPTPRWSSALTAHLATGLTGHGDVGHLRLDRVVQGTHLVIEGVESAEAERLGPVVRAAIDAANRACHGVDEASGPRNMEQAEADRLARAVAEGAKPPTMH